MDSSTQVSGSAAGHTINRTDYSKRQNAWIRAAQSTSAGAKRKPNRAANYQDLLTS